MGFVIQPDALVDVTVSVPKTSHTISLVVFPLTLVAGGIRPDLDTVTVFLPVDFLACVGASIGIGCRQHVDFISALGHTIFGFVFDLELLLILINIGNAVLLIFTFFILDSDLAFVAKVISAALCRASSHF